jgi:ABC-type sugar transport system substrate-binding protein
MIAFDTNRDGNREVYLMGPDGKDPVNLSNNPADDWDPSWSPDGSQIAFVTNRKNGSAQGQFIYVLNADGLNLRQLTTEKGSDRPDWSPDGRMIAYESDGDIFFINADGSGKSTNLTNSPEQDSQPNWSPDSHRLLWLSGKDGRWNIFVMDANGSHKQQLTNDGKVSDAQWTVDGQIFTHWDNKNAGCFNCLMDANGTNVTSAGGKGDIQRYLPFWTWDGNQVECVSGDLNGGNDEIYLVGEIFPDIFLNLTNNPARDLNPDWPAKCGPEKSTSSAGDQQSNPKKDIVIGYAGDNPTQQQRKNNFQKACDELGIRCVYGEIPKLLELGVSAIVQNSKNGEAEGLNQDILNARDKGAPVFLLDAEVITDGAYSVTINHDKWVTFTLDWMMKQMGWQGEIAFFDFQPYNEHKKVIDELLQKNPSIKVMAQHEGEYDTYQIKSDVAAILQANPKLGAIWADDALSDIVFGVADISTPSQKWPLLTCEATKEGLYIWKDRLKDFPGMNCIAVSNPPGIAYDAAYAAYYLATGAQINKSALGGQYGHTLYVDLSVVTQDHLQEAIDKINDQDDAYTVDELMQPDQIRRKWFLE